MTIVRERGQEEAKEVGKRFYFHCSELYPSGSVTHADGACQEMRKIRSISSLNDKIQSAEATKQKPKTKSFSLCNAKL